jgi:hypothetical protein
VHFQAVRKWGWRIEYREAGPEGSARRGQLQPAAPAESFPPRQASAGSRVARSTSTRFVSSSQSWQKA